MSQPRPILTPDPHQPRRTQYRWPSGRIALQYGNTENFHGWAAFADEPFPGLGKVHPTAQEAAASLGATLSEAA